MRVSAILPATDSPPTLDAAERAIATAHEPPEEVVVVRDAPGRGPAAARNEGARIAAGDVLVFVDADVEVHPDAFARIREAYADDPGLAAIFGSYDDSPRDLHVVSVFRNLLHHHVHQSAGGPATTFWAGLGAVRRDAFEAVGGFDARRFPAPSIEDIDLGARLSAGGYRILLDPLLQGTHLKRWTLASMIRTDLLDRGVPWVQLLLDGGADRTALNLGWRYRLSALASVGLAGAAATRRWRAAAASLSLLLVANRSFYALLMRRQGPAGAAAGVLLHATHHLTAAAAVPAALASRLASSLRRQ